MILVQASREDQSGGVQIARARMENRLPGGACIRIKKQIGVGDKLKIEGRWENFSGVARYCRSERKEYLIGIQRDRPQIPISKKPDAQQVPAREELRSSEPAVSAGKVESLPQRPESMPKEIPEDERKQESVPIAAIAVATATMPPREIDHETDGGKSPRSAKPQDLAAFRRAELQTERASKGEEAGKERIPLQRKCFELVHKDNKRQSWRKRRRHERFSQSRARGGSCAGKDFCGCG
jgi:hypothetical protein